MHKRGTLDGSQLHEAAFFHQAFIAAGRDRARVANILHVLGAPGDGLPDAMLDARGVVRAIYDHVGGRDTLSARVLERIVGDDRTIQNCVRSEVPGAASGPKRERVVGVLTAALDGVTGYRGTRNKFAAMRERALKGTLTGALSQGT